MVKLTNKYIINAYKKPKAKNLNTNFNYNNFKYYLIFLFAFILLLFSAPTIAIGIIKGNSISTIFTSSLFVISISFAFCILLLLPSLRSDNLYHIQPYIITTMTLFFLYSYVLQFYINVM